MQINYKRPFTHFVKKAIKPLKLAIKDNVTRISNNPNLGEPKLGDLKGIFIHKFRFDGQEYLMAYRCRVNSKIEIIWIDFYKVGSHENFYDDLKQYLRQE
ncbi:type II toxin-antitoxin system RelE/ParE family toxin [Polynucleobacter antarcticus]|uniref:Type II toxin-antitoxin system RelE/ParE family toxin n=1 Tax=Polynucleobacter antarcticus TaxID=1743162 RepID=A0A6M9PHE2_9BURK|nr:type II toxin-antitoxin system RelE/ParE family toxin [Polynucleobacter antarcticus]QKM62280.1 hypothetical protein DCO16_03855 [Polynucleobacter antarcticus]